MDIICLNYYQDILQTTFLCLKNPYSWWRWLININAIILIYITQIGFCQSGCQVEWFGIDPKLRKTCIVLLTVLWAVLPTRYLHNQVKVDRSSPDLKQLFTISWTISANRQLDSYWVLKAARIACALKLHGYDL